MRHRSRARSSAVRQAKPLDSRCHARAWRDGELKAKYDYGELGRVSLADAITVRKAQGSEFPTVVIPLAMQFLLLQRNNRQDGAEAERCSQNRAGIRGGYLAILEPTSHALRILLWFTLESHSITAIAGNP